MDMRFLFWFLFLLHLSVSAEGKRPNIIFLLSDDQAVRTMGCYGAPGVQTPHPRPAGCGRDDLRRALRYHCYLHG